MKEKKHIITLSCSPSRGRNSDTLLDSFIQGIDTNAETTVEKIYLGDIEIDYYSHENKSGPASHEKDFALLCQKIQDADGLVIATPTYNFSVPAHLKNFIDRIRFFALDLDKRNKLNQPQGKLDSLCTYFIVTGGTPSWAQKILFFAFPPFWLRGVFLYFGAHVLGGLYTGDIQAHTNKRLLTLAQKRGVKFAHHVARGSRNGILETIFWRPPQNDS